MKIKTHIRSALLCAFVFILLALPAGTHADDASTPNFVAPAHLCGIFESKLAPIEVETSRRLDSLDKQKRVARITPILARYQRILANEGFAISPSEIGGQEYRRTTAVATVKFQQKYLAQIRVASPTFEPTGYLDDDTRDFINRRYACQNVAAIQLFNPQNYSGVQTGDVLSVQYRTIGVPAGSVLEFNLYKAEGTKNTGKTLIGTVVASSSATSTASAVSSFDWVIPSSLSTRTYRVGVSIRSVENSEKFIEAFKVTKKTVVTPSVTTVLSPNGGEYFRVGDSVRLAWINSNQAAYKGYKVYLVDIASSTEALITESNSNNINDKSGVYTWTIPQTLGGLSLNAISKSTYKLKVVNGTTATSSDMSEALFTIATSGSAAIGNNTAPTSPFVYTITPTKRTYAKGENIKFTFTIRNASSSPVTARYSSGCSVSYTIGVNGDVYPENCTMATTQYTYAAGATRTYEFTHPKSIITGTRLIKVNHIGYGVATTTVSVTQ